MKALFPMLMLAGCTPTLGQPDTVPPMVAIERASASAPGGYLGNFAITVKTAGRDRDVLYLNSQEDYRDPRNLSIAVQPVAQMQLEQRLRVPADVALIGHRIVVTGAAHRVRIDFTQDGARSGKYYYQTHVAVVRGEQLRVAD